MQRVFAKLEVGAYLIVLHVLYKTLMSKDELRFPDLIRDVIVIICIIAVAIVLSEAFRRVFR